MFMKGTLLFIYTSAIKFYRKADRHKLLLTGFGNGHLALYDGKGT